MVAQLYRMETAVDFCPSGDPASGLELCVLQQRAEIPTQLTGRRAKPMGWSRSLAWIILRLLDEIGRIQQFSTQWVGYDLP